MVEKIKIFTLIGIIAIIGNWVGFQVNPIEAIPGMAIIIVITILGMAITSALPFKIPAVVWVSLIALIVTTPIFPGNGWIVD